MEHLSEDPQHYVETSDQVPHELVILNVPPPLSPPIFNPISLAELHYFIHQMWNEYQRSACYFLSTRRKRGISPLRQMQDDLSHLKHQRVRIGMASSCGFFEVV
ncbi:hypothetical protein EMCRGX_G001616 [Ephydatia muelleri]